MNSITNILKPLDEELLSSIGTILKNRGLNSFKIKILEQSNAKHSAGALYHKVLFSLPTNNDQEAAFSIASHLFLWYLPMLHLNTLIVTARAAFVEEATHINQISALAKPKSILSSLPLSFDSGI